MGNCSNGCDKCKPNDKCDSKDSCCNEGSCDCDAKYATAYQQAMKDNGLRCLLCGNFYMNRGKKTYRLVLWDELPAVYYFY